jgi:hypothetical protein
MATEIKRVWKVGEHEFETKAEVNEYLEGGGEHKEVIDEYLDTLPEEVRAGRGNVTRIRRTLAPFLRWYDQQD